MQSLSRRSMSRRNKRNFGSIFKEAAAFSSGAIFGIVPQFLFGLIMFLSGLYLIRNENKNEKDEKKQKNELKYYIGLGLLILGCVLCIGLGFDILINELF